MTDNIVLNVTEQKLCAVIPTVQPELQTHMELLTINSLTTSLSLKVLLSRKLKSYPFEYHWHLNSEG